MTHKSALDYPTDAIEDFVHEALLLIEKYKPLIESKMYLDDEHTQINYNHVRPSFVLVGVDAFEEWLCKNYKFFVEVNLDEDYYPLMEAYGDVLMKQFKRRGK
ncbi:MAG: hypothetical protein WC307_07125 [Candidatus Nanoarchaeia archaeon]|jgi:hypothetical protein